MENPGVENTEVYTWSIFAYYFVFEAYMAHSRYSIYVYKEYVLEFCCTKQCLQLTILYCALKIFVMRIDLMLPQQTDKRYEETFDGDG